MRLQVLLALCTMGGQLPSAAAQEWSRFRGPNGSGVSASVLPTRWTENDYRWQIKLPGRGHSSPVLWGDKLFLTSDVAGSLHVLCLDAASGKKHWSHEFVAAHTRGHKDNSLASSTPAADASRVYVAWGNAKEVVLVALSHEGKDLWRRDLGPYKAGHGFGSSPIVHDGLVILPCEQDGKDNIAAVDAATGEVRWRIARKSRNTYATPCVFQPIGKPAELIAVSYEDGITSLDPTTGKRNWELDAFDKRHVEGAIASPIVHGDLVIGSAGWLGVRYETIAIRVESRERERPELSTAYKLDRGAPLVPTPIAHGDLLFMWDDRGVVTCVNVKTGETFWRERVDGTFYASPVIAGKHLYCPSREGDMFILAADQKYQAPTRVSLGEAPFATPAVAHGRMFIRTLTRVLCVEAAASRTKPE